MWVARDKDGTLKLFSEKPIRIDNDDDMWLSFVWYPENVNTCKRMQIDSTYFPNLTWGDEPLEVILTPVCLDGEDENPKSITLTRYHKSTEKYKEWFTGFMRRGNPDLTEDDIENEYQEHIRETYFEDEIWALTQCDGYTKVLFPMGRHDCQHEYDCVLETKEFIESYFGRKF